MRSAVPLLIYDGDCGFCRAWVERWRRATGRRVRFLPFQSPGLLRAYGIPRRSAERAVQLLEPDGRRYLGAEAVFRVLQRASSSRVRALARLGRLRGLRALAQSAYGWVARHRRVASRFTKPLLSATSQRRRAGALCLALGLTTWLAVTLWRRRQ
jgi:predicted DCC family thiol-disulfide oxidoreductase YuxK